MIGTRTAYRCGRSSQRQARLKNRTAIITGANRGFGLAVAKEFVREGASVAICARGSSELEMAVKSLRAIAGPGQRVIAAPLDVSIEDGVKAFIEKNIGELGRIDILVNNAGIHGPKGLIEDVDGAEWVKAIQTNLLGVFHGCKHIIPHMKRNGYGKIINLSGGGATSPFPRVSAYAASKAAIVRLTETLAEECRGCGIDINAIAPGAMNTRLLDDILEAGPEGVGESYYAKALKQKANGGVPLEKGVGLCVFLASSESDGITGKLISAVWDPWADLAKHKEELEQTDIYTLRRIIPEERGKSWS